MPRYSVTLPIAGFAVVEVIALDESDAITEAMGCVDMKDIETWDAYKKIVEGNVFRGPQNNVEVELIDDE